MIHAGNSNRRAPAETEIVENRTPPVHRRHLPSVHEIAVGPQLAMKGVKSACIGINDRPPNAVETNSRTTIDSR